jgi:hypothetical protein
MPDIYRFEHIVHAMHSKIQAGDWPNAERDVLLLSALTNLNAEQKQFIHGARMHIKARSKASFETLYNTMESKMEHFPDFKLRLNLKEWLLYVRPDLLRVFTAWFAGLWVILIAAVILYYGRCTLSDLFSTFGVSFLSVASAAALIFMFHIDRRGTMKDIAFLIFTTCIVPSIIALIHIVFIQH